MTDTLQGLLRRHRGFALLCLVFTACILIYADYLPPYEGPDEVHHIAYILHIRQTGGLPNPLTDSQTTIQQQAGQMPLYYIVASVITAPVNVQGVNIDDAQRNPWFGSPLITSNANEFMMSPDNHALTPEQQRLAQFNRIARLSSLGFGWLALFGVYWAGLSFFTGYAGRRDWALLAALLFGLTPIALQVFSVTTNDSAAIAFSTLIIGAGLRIYTAGWDNRGWLLVAGGLMGIAALCKVNTLALWGVPAVAILLSWLKTTPPDKRITQLPALFKAGMTALIPALLIAGWAYGRAWALSGDPFGIQPHTEMPWAMPQGEERSILDATFSITSRLESFWFTGGTGDVRTEMFFYILPIMIVVLGLLGWFKDRKFTQKHLILALAALGGFAILIHWMQLMGSFAMGRLYLPYVAALILLLVDGLYRLGLGRYFRAGLAGLYGGVVVIVFVSTLHQGFGRPPLYDTLPQHITPIELDFGPARFVGYHIEQTVIQPEADIPITLCWQAPDGDSPVPVPYPFTVQLIAVDDETGEMIEPMVTAAQFDSYPGLGNYTLWQAGKIFCDSFIMSANTAAQPELNYMVYVTLYDWHTQAAVPAFSPSAGHNVLPVVGIMRGN